MAGRKYGIVIFAVLLAGGLAGSVRCNRRTQASGSLSDPVEEAMLAYQNSNLTRAKRLAKARLDDPMARLVFHLCQVHDAENPDLAAGLAGLKTIFEDETIDPAIRAEAGLDYGRVIQIYQARKMHPQYDNVDVRAVFRAVIGLLPEDAKACIAAKYLAETYFFKQDKRQARRGFEFVERFLANYTGPDTNIVPLHLFVELFYIDIEGNYSKAFEHLRQAYRIGISTDVVKREVLYRMGRICHVHLKDTEQAGFYYRQFLQRYPAAYQAPVVEKYLRQLGQAVTTGGRSVGRVN